MGTASFIETHKQALEQYKSHLLPLLSVNLNGMKGSIMVHEDCWIADGSGKLTLANGEEFRFHLEKGKVVCPDSIATLLSHLLDVLLISNEIKYLKAKIASMEKRIEQEAISKQLNESARLIHERYERHYEKLKKYNR